MQTQFEALGSWGAKERSFGCGQQANPQRPELGVGRSFDLRQSQQ